MSAPSTPSNDAPLFSGRDSSAATGSDELIAHLTEAQRLAIRTIDRSVLVSAAAGAGKTTVLAERCAYLVCDLPADHRVEVDRLLVVTFTEAAAGEMRTRIRAAIERRVELRPRDAWLQRQVHFVDSAAISTIHAFCRSLIQRWFPQAGVDPQAAVLAGDEAELLRRETLRALLDERYGRADDTGVAFARLIDDYGGGEERAIVDAVLRVHSYVNSLPDPEAWLSRSESQFDVEDAGSLRSRLDELQRDRLIAELNLQIDNAQVAAEQIRRTWPVAVDRAESIDVIVDALQEYVDRLAGHGDAWEEVAAAITAYIPPRLTSKPRKLAAEAAEPYDLAKQVVDKIKRQFENRLQKKLCRFTRDELLAGLARIAPYTRTLVQLVRDLDRRYQEAKSGQNVVDFNDLQRAALRILCVDGDTARPSPIAALLQQRYRFILVDEFQDVDPLQEAILRLVSTESADPPGGNLFAVGDIKQSVYRFRLAEPRLFADRADRFAGDPAAGALIPLRENFRSRAGIIDFANLVFDALMSRDFGGSDYDDMARLRAGAAYPATGAGPLLELPAAEVHLLEPITERTRVHGGDDDDESTGEDADADETADNDADELEGIEREAHLIGQRIRSLMGLDGEPRAHVADRPATPGGPPGSRPIDFGDIVILLRSTRFKAEPMADVLRRLGIPVRVARGESMFDSTEFRDVLALLQLLDNRQQDLPLAAVLRSPLAGEPLSADDLLRIRAASPDVPFHEAFARFIATDGDSPLQQRLRAVAGTLDRWSERMRQTPVARALWEIFEAGDYLGYVSGLPGGAHRRRRLVQLHQQARQFDGFARQGLHRFVRFLEEASENDTGSTPDAGAGDDTSAVRLMTVHTSKGLEFPVVVLADLQKSFNLEDARGTVLVDRELGIALRAVDPDRRIHYPTFAQQLASERIQRESLAEELRLLYVALTRARERLILVGRISPALAASFAAGAGSRPRPARLRLETGGCWLNWLMEALACMPAGRVAWEGDAGDEALVRVRAYPRTETDGWSLPALAKRQRADTLDAFARLQPLPAGEPLAEPGTIAPVLEALDTPYRATAITSIPARVTVSDLKGRWDPLADPEQRADASRGHGGGRIVPLPRFIAPDEAPESTSRGTAVHRFLELLDLAAACDAEDLVRQRDDLVLRGLLTSADAGLIDLDDAAWFFATELGQRMRRRADRVHREVPFVAALPVDAYDPLVTSDDPRDVLLVRGMVDAMIRGDGDLEIIDYKTDRVRGDTLAARRDYYGPQLRHYARALAGIHRVTATRSWLVFLHARHIAEVES